LDHLALDGIAGFLLPLPDALFKFFTAQVAAVEAFFGELAFHYHLSGNSGVVGAGSQRVLSPSMRCQRR